jgi:hypothetical protein
VYFSETSFAGGAANATRSWLARPESDRADDGQNSAQGNALGSSEGFSNAIRLNARHCRPRPNRPRPPAFGSVGDRTGGAHQVP